MIAFLFITSFVFWLISFPMGGFLLKHEYGILLFLITHIPSLLIFGLLVPYSYFDKMANFSIGLTSILTATYPFLDNKDLVIAALGISSSFLSIKTGVALKIYNNPLSLTGVAVGNLLSFFLSSVDINENYKYLIISIFISLVLINIKTVISNNMRVNLRKYELTFIFLLYLTGGVMYGSLMPVYSEFAWLNHSEVIFYSLAVCLGVCAYKYKLFSEKIWVSFIILFIGLSFALMHVLNPISINISMYFIQSGFGLADIYLLYILLGAGNPQKAFGLGYSTVCTAILLGALAGISGINMNIVVGVANIALILIAIYYALYGSGRGIGAPAVREQVKNVKDILKVLEDKGDNLSANLSPREREVVIMYSKGKSVHEISEILGISVSSVREYLRRACVKLDIDLNALSDFPNFKD